MAIDYYNKEASRESGEVVSFSFGRNWQKFLASVDDERLTEARLSLAEAIGLDDLKGRSFIDAGSGSGVFSLSAYRMGTSQLTSVDVDPNSIACVQALRKREGSPEVWEVRQGSLLDAAFVNHIEPADVVYSWGVLHHTGAMWTAVANTMRLVKPGGIFCLALYNRPRWLKLHLLLKRTYNRLPEIVRPLATGLYAAVRLTLSAVRQRKSLIAIVRDYGKHSRGMSFWRDVEDWLGGLPYEFAEAKEVAAFAEDHGFTVERVLCRTAGANNDYLLRRRA